MKNKYDPGDQISWLEKELGRIEGENARAIIIAHYPTQRDCTHSFGHRFRAIIDRYQHIVRVSFYGHTHREDIQVVKSIYGEHNIHFNYFGGSVTTGTNKNPSFNVIEFDKATMLPLNIKTYAFDLAQANLDDQPTWTLFHD